MRVPLTAAAAVALATLEQTGGAIKGAAALREVEAACRALVKHQKFDIAVRPPAYRLQGTYEWLRGHPEEAQKLWQKSLEHAEKLGARYEGALTRLEIGRRWATERLSRPPRPSSRRWAPPSTWPRPADSWAEQGMSRRTPSRWSRTEG